MNPFTSTTITMAMHDRDLHTCKGGSDQLALGLRSGGESWLNPSLAV